MRIKRITIGLLIVALGRASLHAYEVPVHRQITSNAFERVTVDFRAQLGVDRDHQINDDTLLELMIKGSADEDDFPRPLNHFFDPVHNAPLTTRLPLAFCLANGTPAPVWGIQEVENSYSVTRAREHYRIAVIGPTAGARDVSLRELFLSLGHLAHLVQDMAQPEHTRNDQHLTNSNLILGNATEPSLWEKWGKEYLVTKQDPVTKNDILPVVAYDGYPNVTLPDYASYFHTAAGQGMADFANRSFVTQDTNYSDEDSSGKCYSYPDAPRLADAARRVEKDVTYVILDGFGDSIHVTVDEEIYTSFPYDGYTGGQEQDPFHTYFSALDLETQKYGVRTFSLGDGSFLSRASMLIPRAVGYSAGIVSHLFRGKIDVGWKSVGSGVYDMTITNRSKEAIGADARVEAVFRADAAYIGLGSADTGRIVKDELSVLVPGYVGLAPGESLTIYGLQPFGLKPGDSLLDFERRIVITGTLGTEPNAVAALVQEKTPHTPFRAEITFDTRCAPGSIFAIDTPLGFNFAGVYTLDSNPIKSCSTGSPQICVEKPAGLYGMPIVATISRFDPGMSVYFLGDLQQPCTFTFNFYENNTLRLTDTRLVFPDQFGPTAPFATLMQYP